MIQLDIFEYQIFNDVNQSEEPQVLCNAKTQEKVRNIMTNQSNQICLVYDPSEDYYTFPGGHVEKGELPVVAAERETLEETGATIKEINAFAICREFRTKAETLQTTYYYTSLLSSQGKENLTSEEEALGMRAMWFTSEQCMEILKNQKNSGYHQKFSGYRDLEVFRMYERETQHM